MTRIEVVEVQRHGVRRAENHPIDGRLLASSAILKNGLLWPVLTHELLGRMVQARVQRSPHAMKANADRPRRFVADGGAVSMAAQNCM